MGFMKSVQGSLVSEYFQLLESVAFMKAGTMAEVALYEKHMTLKAAFKKEVVSLKYDQITDVFYGLKTELKEKNKSVIGRAIVGGALLGPLGAIIGGTSGVGKKSKRDTKTYFIISYLDSKGNDKLISAEDIRKFKGKKLALRLQQLTNQSGYISDENNTIYL
jgi:nucleoside permease NupC